MAPDPAHLPPPVLPGVDVHAASLLHDRGRPDFRDVFLALAGRAGEIRTAVTRVRLSTLDLDWNALAGVRTFRVLVAELNALTLDAEARVLVHHPRRSTTLRALTERLERGTLAVRSAPLGGWSPDFTVFSAARGGTHLLTGFHWFERPYPHRGPALASLHCGEPARMAARRHDELWERAHDVGPAVWSLLARADTVARRRRATG